MKYRISLIFIGVLLVKAGSAQQVKIDQVSPGVYKLTSGTPDKFSPYAFCTGKPLDEALSDMPFPLESVMVRVTPGSCVELQKYAV